MRRFLSILAAIALLVAPAAAQKTPAAVQAEINSGITTNGAGAITGAILNGVLNDIASSYGGTIVGNSWTAAQTFSVNPVLSACTGYLYGNAASAVTCGALAPATLPAPEIGITRAQIASHNLTGYTKFSTTNGCGWVSGSSSGPMAIQDSVSNWWQLDLSGGVVNVLCFGADPTGVADSGSAISAAATAGEAAGVYTLTFPAGTYLACNSGSTIAFGANGIRLVGAGPDSTTIKCTSGTQNMLSWSGTSFDGGVSGIKLLGTGMTGGNIISAASVQRFRIIDCVFGGGYNGVFLQNFNTASIAKTVFTGQTGSYAIEAQGLTAGAANVLDIDDTTIGFSTNTSSSPSGIILDSSVATVDIRHVGVTKGFRGLSLTNSQSLSGTTVLFVTALDFQVDSMYDSCIYLDGAGGTSEGHLFTDIYCHHSANSHGVYITSSVSYTSFKGGVVVGSYLNGFYIAGKFISVSDMQVSTNSQSGSGAYPGVELAATSVGARIHDNLLGAWTGYGAELQSYGVQLDASATLYSIIGNDLRGNVTGDYSDNANDANGLIGPNVALSTSKIKLPQPVQFTGTGTFQANGSVATALTSVGPTGSRTTVQKWLTVYDGNGNPFYVPLF